jgi:hypothetical protein
MNAAIDFVLWRLIAVFEITAPGRRGGSPCPRLDLSSDLLSRHSEHRLNVQIRNLQRIAYDKVAPRFYYIAHQGAEHFGRIFRISDFHLQ